MHLIEIQNAHSANADIFLQGKFTDKSSIRRINSIIDKAISQDQHEICKPYRAIQKQVNDLTCKVRLAALKKNCLLGVAYVSMVACAILLPLVVSLAIAVAIVAGAVVLARFLAAPAGIVGAVASFTSLVGALAGVATFFAFWRSTFLPKAIDHLTGLASSARKEWLDKEEPLRKAVLQKNVLKVSAKAAWDARKVQWQALLALKSKNSFIYGLPGELVEIMIADVLRAQPVP